MPRETRQWLKNPALFRPMINLRKITRWAVTALAALCLVPIINLNVERLAEARGWDQFLTRYGGQIMSDLAQLAESPWFIFFFGLAAGAALFMWADVLLRKIKIIRPNIPTSITIQFQANSLNVRQLANENIVGSHFDRMKFEFLGVDGRPVMEERILWYGVLIFDRPTHYGQIIIDAGNAKIPEYRIVEQKINYAIVRFEGDIGNVALTIKCVPANPAAQSRNR